MSSTCPEADGAGTSRTRVIAHRGACAYAPEHTLAAKALAYGMGAEFLEQDVVATRDEVLVVLHDLYLDDVSDVAACYPGRQREDGRFYVVDFACHELEALRLNERRRPAGSGPKFPGRYPYESPMFRVVRLEDELRLVAGLNAATGRRVGLYPEIKEPEWHDRNGIDLTRLLHRCLEDARPLINGPVFIQSFDRSALCRLRDEFASDWPRIFLIDEALAQQLGSRPEILAEIGEYAVGVGLPYEALIAGAGLRSTAGSDAGPLRPSDLALHLRSAGLQIHPYTLRRDAVSLHGAAYETALAFLIRDLQVDAIFCDHPDDALAVRTGSGV